MALAVGDRTGTGTDKRPELGSARFARAQWNHRGTLPQRRQLGVAMGIVRRLVVAGAGVAVALSLAAVGPADPVEGAPLAPSPTTVTPSSDWTLQAGQVRPVSLRLWKPSTSLSNYEMEFLGHIDRKSMDWAFRAADLHNYYATKLVITHPGPLPNAGLVRYVVLDDRERERVELPLPLTLENGVDYRVRVSVRGNRFLTSVNGQLISSWMDSRISRGGVGFFSEDGESSMLKWVSASERDSFIARLASHFSLLTFPAPGVTDIR